MQIRVYSYRPKPPYMFSAHLERFTLPSAPTPWLYDRRRRTATRLLVVEGSMVGVAVSFQGEPWEPLVTVRAVAEEESVARIAFHRVLDIIRADYDYNEFVEKAKPYPQLLRLAEEYPGLRPGRCVSLYNALVDAIVKQRVSLRQALQAMSRLVAMYSPSLEYRGLVFYDYPLPQRLAEAGIDEIRGQGLTRVKARALQEVAMAEMEGRLPRVEEAEKDPASVVEELKRLYGVGPWTAELAVAMVLKKFPLGPYTDLAVTKGLQRLLGVGMEEARKMLRELGDVAGLAMYLAAYSYEEYKRVRRKRK